MHSLLGFFAGLIQTIGVMLGFSYAPAVPAEPLPSPQQVVNQYGTLPHGLSDASGFGVIAGNVAYPKSCIPAQIVCAQDVKESSRSYCSAPTNGGCIEDGVDTSFSIQVPVGTYTVYAHLVRNPKDKAYYNEFATCGESADCPKIGHSKYIPVVVTANATSTANPTDWYAGPGPDDIVVNGSGTSAASSPGISVPGMSKYTDSDFGFSFWYPSGWSVKAGSIIDCSSKFGESAGCKNRSIDLDSQTGRVMNINVIYKPYVNNDSSGATIAGPSMGGITLYSSGAYGRENTITELDIGPHLGLAISGLVGNAYTNTIPLAKTIVASDATVATPVSTAEQIATIQAEGTAYNVQKSSCTQNGQTYYSGQVFSEIGCYGHPIGDQKPCVNLICKNGTIEPYSGP